MYEILVEEKFDAAHCLVGYPGNCEKLHGHTYKVQVVLRAEKTDSIGMAIDFRSVKAELREVLSFLDHTYLNDLPQFSSDNPSAENLARFIYSKMQEKFTNTMHRVTVWETDSSAATYWE